MSYVFACNPILGSLLEQELGQNDVELVAYFFPIFGMKITFAFATTSTNPLLITYDESTKTNGYSLLSSNIVLGCWVDVVVVVHIFNNHRKKRTEAAKTKLCWRRILKWVENEEATTCNLQSLFIITIPLNKYNHTIKGNYVFVKDFFFF